jgi:ATP-dependent DNA ligase
LASRTSIASSRRPSRLPDAHNAILDGEIVCLDDDGKSNFHKLLFRRDWPHFYAFDLLAIDGEDLIAKSLIERKRRLRDVMPRIQSGLLYVDHLERRGCGLYHAACERDLEGIWPTRVVRATWREARRSTRLESARSQLMKPGCFTPRCTSPRRLRSKPVCGLRPL